MRNLLPLVALATSLCSFATEATPTSISRFASDKVQLSNSRIAGTCVNGTYIFGKDAATVAKSQLNVKTVASAASAPEMITEKPEGTDMVYSRSGDAFKVYMQDVTQTTQKSASLFTVLSPDKSKVYIMDIVSSARNETYVVGNIEGNTISVPTDQCIAYWPTENYGMKVAVGKMKTAYDDWGDVTYTYVYDSDSKEITYTIGEDNTIAIDKKFTSADSKTAPDYIVGLFSTADNSWAGYADWNSAYTPFNETATTLPDGVEISTYLLEWSAPSSSPDYVAPSQYQVLKTAVKDSKFYIAGLVNESPDCAVVGEIADGKVTFASNQFIGLMNSYFTYFIGGYFAYEPYIDPWWGIELTKLVFNPSESIVFDYDAETGCLNPAVENPVIYLSAGTATSAADLSALNYFTNVKLYPFPDVAATPATPEISFFYNEGDKGYFCIAGFIPTFDTEGNYIDPHKIKYTVWKENSGEQAPYVFYAWEYPNIGTELNEESITEIPYYFASKDLDNLDGIILGATKIWFNQKPPQRIGLQTIYYGGNERNESDIFWYNISTTSVGTIETIQPAVPQAIYGADGVYRAKMTKGMNIIRMSDGSVKKVIVK